VKGGRVYHRRAMREPLYLVTGGAGFIGSQLVTRLLRDGARVRVLDNFSTGTRANLAFPPDLRRRVEVVRGDVRELATVARAARGARVVFHQAAMRSVPRSIKDPLGANANNVTGTLHVLEAARRARVPRVPRGFKHVQGTGDIEAARRARVPRVVYATS